MSDEMKWRMIIAGGIVFFAAANTAWNLGWKYFFTEIYIEVMREQINAHGRAKRAARNQERMK